MERSTDFFRLNLRRLVLRSHALPMALVVRLRVTEFTERPTSHSSITSARHGHVKVGNSGYLGRYAVAWIRSREEP
jgi:hypothetical protein